MTEGARMVRRLWRPRTIAGIASPLVLTLVATNVDGYLTEQSNGQHSVLDRRGLGALNAPVHFALVIVAALLAVYAVRVFVRALNDFLDDYLGLGRSRSLATFASVVLYAIIALLVVSAVGHNLSGVLVGGALTGVVVGIAGQASLSNIIAGLVILFARPYNAGMYVTARAGSFGGVEYSGQVWDISLFYTTLHVNSLEVRIPNSAMINAVVVRRPREYEVYLPVTLPKATEDAPAVMNELRGVVARATDAGAPRVTLDSISDVGYVVGVRAFVADDDARRAIEDAVARIVATVVDAVAAQARAEEDGAAPPEASGTNAAEETPDAEEDRATIEEHGERASVASRAV